MKPTVFFLPGTDQTELLDRLPLLLDKLIDKQFNGDALCGIKVHFGEKGNRTFIPADYSRVGVDFLAKKGAKPFLFETNTLYYGSRGNTIDHLNLAAEHGFSADKIDAPVVIADGMRGEDSVRIPVVNGKHVKEAILGKMIPEIQVMVGFSHFKGHMLSGFGASIKNFSMGTAARGGKLQMHSLSKPWIDEEKCNACGLCAQQCPVQAIESRADVFVIDETICTGCAGCIGVCPQKAVRIKWNEASESASEKMAEYALASVFGKKVFYVNFALNITPECDCWGKKMKPIREDVGILASLDPVAVDQACFDITETEIRSAHQDVDPEIQLVHAERIGLGTRNYQLEEL